MSYYILDAMRVDRDSAKKLLYNTGELDANGKIAPICNPAAVTGTGLADNNLRDWITSLQSEVKTTKANESTCGAVWCEAEGNCRIQVSWNDEGLGGLGAQMVETFTQLGPSQ